MRRLKMKWHNFWGNYHQKRADKHDTKYVRLMEWDDVEGGLYEYLRKVAKL